MERSTLKRATEVALETADVVFSASNFYVAGLKTALGLLSNRSVRSYR
jgi:hypothetical protein